MLVKEVRKITDRKSEIRLEDGSSFVLYSAEARRLHIAQQEDISPETLRLIMDEILKKRACLRCMHLLRMADRTEEELRRRLERDGYPGEVIVRALAYVASFHYTDDRRYAQNYIRRESGRKSRRQIEFELLKKGVDHDTVRAAFSEEEEQCPDREKEAILALLRKRGFDAGSAGAKEVSAQFRYLAAKGFGYEAIKSAVREASYFD